MSIHTRRQRTAPWTAVATALAVATAAPAGATGRSTTVRTTIDIPAMVVDNLCNADVVALSGDLTITTVTTPTSDGGYTVQSSAVARDLRGSRIAPLPAIGYRGSDAEDTVSRYAPPPYPSTHETLHYTELVPQGKAPRMDLVVVLLEVTTDAGTTPVLDRTYLVCTPPSRPGK
jgi:hypothetical protein